MSKGMGHFSSNGTTLCEPEPKPPTTVKPVITSIPPPPEQLHQASKSRFTFRKRYKAFREKGLAPLLPVDNDRHEHSPVWGNKIVHKQYQYIEFGDTEVRFDEDEIKRVDPNGIDWKKSEDPFAIFEGRKYHLDPYRWIFRKIENEEFERVQKDLVEYVKITSNHPHLFVPYGVLIGQVGEMSSTTIPFLGCSKGGKELIGHLSVRPKEINADLLYFVSSQACDAVFVLNEAGYMLQIKNLETAFQVCRVGRQEFQVRLGELSAALMYLKWLITEEGSFVAYDKRIPCKSREARQVNSHFLDHFLKTIVQIAKDCHLPDFTTESLESKATSQAQERNYDVGKVNESFYEIQKDIDVWYGCTPSSPVQWGSDKQGYLTSSHAIVETANVI